MSKPRLASVCALVAGVVVLTTGCDTVQPVALEVNGSEVSRESVDRELRAIADNEAFVDATGGDATRTEGTLNAMVTAQWLTLRVEAEVVDREIDEREIQVTGAAREAGQQRAESFFGSPEVFDGFPPWFRDRVLQRFAQRSALLEALDPEASAGPTDDEVRAVYEEQLAQERAQCPSGRFVAHILVESRAEADALAAQLAGGADFTELARAESIDTQSAEVGGELFCFDPARFVPEFSTAVAQLALGQVSAPVATDFGFHLIVVRDTVPFEAVEPVVRESLAGEEQGDGALQELIADAGVSVDPRYGRWRVRDGIGGVEPQPAVSPTTSTSLPASPLEG